MGSQNERCICEASGYSKRIAFCTVNIIPEVTKERTIYMSTAYNCFPFLKRRSITQNNFHTVTNKTGTSNGLIEQQITNRLSLMKCLIMKFQPNQR